MPQSAEVKGRKKSAFSCEMCRKRKVKCDGQEPRCARCIARNDVCEYQLSPTLSYTHKLEERISQLESLLSMSGHPAQEASSFTEATSQQLPTHPTSEEPATGWGSEGLTLSGQSITDPYTTSFFTLPQTETTNGGLSSLSGQQLDYQRRERLVQNAWKQRGLEGLAETPEPFQYMLNNHWCWIQPLFNFIYRPAFTRDMHDLGPYYSRALLNALLAHSSRWCRSDPHIRSLLVPYDNGALFARHARALLFDEIIAGKCRVPTVQTLLLLSASKCGAGNRTSAWLYSGMAAKEE